MPSELSRRAGGQYLSPNFCRYRNKTFSFKMPWITTSPSPPLDLRHSYSPVCSNANYLPQSHLWRQTWFFYPILGKLLSNCKEAIPLSLLPDMGLVFLQKFAQKCQYFTLIDQSVPLHNFYITFYLRTNQLWSQVDGASLQGGKIQIFHNWTYFESDYSKNF